jgi:hypothetical protein
MVWCGMSLKTDRQSGGLTDRLIVLYCTVGLHCISQCGCTVFHSVDAQYCIVWMHSILVLETSKQAGKKERKKERVCEGVMYVFI